MSAWLPRYTTHLTYIALSLWLVLVASLFITDVWDETNALLILESEPVVSVGVVRSVAMIWLQELPLNMYRPVANSFFMTFGKLSDGSFVALRLFNAALVLGAAALFCGALASRGVSAERRLAFFVILLFSASSLITATWFTNIFDASCLFFIALATWAYCKRRVLLCCAGIGLAVFSKEAYVLIIPLGFLLFARDNDRSTRKIVIIVTVFISLSVLYWVLRQAAVPLGSEQDLRNFSTGNLTNSISSFLAGLAFQFSKFTRNDPVYWLGLAVLLAAFIGLRDLRAKLAMLGLLVLCVVVYWGMFGHQDGIMTYHNFVGRLFLVPFAVLLFILARDGRWPVLVLVGLASLWGFIATYRDHGVFQNTYREVYELAAQTDGTLVIHYPNKPLDDFRRGLVIGDYPDAAVSIDIINGGLTGADAE